eukprot:gene28056-31157_t
MSPTVGNAITDRLWGTMNHTHGAAIQLPRKTPMRVEPKSFFALERTFLSWIGMAVTLGGVSSALVGFTGGDEDSGRLISGTTINIVTCIYAPLSILIMVYALFTYEWRSRSMKKKLVGFVEDKVGPVTVAVLVLITLIVIFFISLVDYL